MSLHHLAEQVRAAGRKNDKVLVHMTPNEVNGLQALALAHGGSLTINPDTGLPEADFLDAILPMAAGFLLAPLTAGTSLAFLGATPLASALTVGAVSGLATGSLEKGLMAGLGAYGGAGLGAGLSGTTAASTTASGAPAIGTATTQAPTSLFGGTNIGGAANSALSGGANANNLALNAFSVPTPTATASLYNPNAIAANFQLPANAVAAPTQYMAPTAQGNLFSTAVNPTSVQNQMALSNQAAATVPANMVAPAAAPASTSMFSNYSMPTDMGKFYDKLPTGTLPALAVTGMQAMKPKQSGLGALPTSDSYERPYEYSVEQDPNAYVNDGSTRERAYFTEPRFKALPVRKVADGGLMDDSAGKVERMSEGNVVTMQQAEDSYSRYADGGVARFGLGGSTVATAKEEPSTNVSYTYDPATMQYTQTTTAPPPSTPTNAAFANPFLGGLMGLFNVGPYATGVNPRLGGMGGTIPGFAKQMQQAAPVTTTQTMGGMSTPYVPSGLAASAPAFANSQIVPNINIPAQQTPEEQLGLQGFYQNMEKQLAAKGAQIMSQNMAEGGMADAYYADGGYTLGGYSDGGRLLKGPGDGVSDSIPAVIGDKQPARLADGEFVVPARIVSELGNGSTEAGAKKLYAMMNRVQNARKKSIGKDKVAVNSRAEKLLPA